MSAEWTSPILLLYQLLLKAKRLGLHFNLPIHNQSNRKLDLFSLSHHFHLHLRMPNRTLLQARDHLPMSFPMVPTFLKPHSPRSKPVLL